MNRRKFIRRVGLGALATLAPWHLLHRPPSGGPGNAPLDVDTSGAIQLDYPRLAVIGIGSSGKRMTPILARDFPELECHDLDPAPFGHGPLVPDDLLASIRGNDMQFLLGDFEDTSRQPLFESIGAELRGTTDGISVGMIPDRREISERVHGESIQPSKSVDCLLRMSPLAMIDPDKYPGRRENRQALTEYAMRHTVGIIAELLTRPGLIGIDYADIKTIMLSGPVGFLGMGVAKDFGKGRIAALRAMDRLENQGAPLSTAKGVLACVHGSSLLTMEDFEEASLTIHEALSDETDIIIGLCIDEQLRSNAKVSILMTT